MELTLKLTAEEINVVSQTLSNLPTPSDAKPLTIKIKPQAVGTPDFKLHDDD